VSFDFSWKKGLGGYATSEQEPPALWLSCGIRGSQNDSSKVFVGSVRQTKELSLLMAIRRSTELRPGNS
jgi:hypothetical protein